MPDVGKRLAQLSPAQREALLKKLKKSGKTVKREKIEKRTAADVFPVSFQQQQLWFLNRLDPESPFYNMPSVVRMQGQLDMASLKKTMAKICERHEILRAVFPTVNGAVQQHILSQIEFDLEPFDASGLNSAKISELIHGETQQPFDLHAGPLIRSKLYRLSQTEHILAVTMHHIIADGWSIGVFVEDFAAIYSAFHSSQEPLLVPLPVQYADYADWQNKWIQTDKKEKQSAYWEKRLSSVSHFLELPYDRPRPAAQTFNGAHIPFTLPAKLVEKIQRSNKEQSITLFMQLMAAFQTLLHLYSGAEDISIGTTMAGRERPELSRLIGFFINTLIIHGDFSANPAFSDFLQQIKTSALDAFANQDLPFEKIVEKLQPERTSSYPPLFQVLFVLQNAPKGKLELPDLTLSLVDTQLSAVKFDLSLIFEEVDDHIQGLMGYNTDLFDTVTIEHLISHFITLLEQVNKNPQLPVSEIQLISSSEKELLFNKWKTENKTPAQNICIHKVFEEQAAKTPQAPAVVFENKIITYRQLNEASNRLAACLTEQGAGPETIAAIGMERSPQMITALLAVLKTGSAFLPVDIHNPQDRVDFILADTSAPLLLTNTTSADLFSSYNGTIILLDDIEDKLQKYPVQNPHISIELTNLAYVIFTSGSTGIPKGVLLSHNGLYNLTRSLGNKYNVNANSRCLQFASFSFDAAVEEILTPLTHGAALVLMKRNAMLSTAELSSTIKDNRLSHMTLSPSLLSALNPQDFPDLKVVNSMGESCPPALASDWCTHVDFFNGYGPTENTVGSIINHVDKKVNSLRVSIGRPLDNIEVYILNSKMQPLPAGLPGEIYLSGPGLARGYLNRPDLTAEKFVPNPFNGKPGSRLYRSGDLGRYMSDGNIDFTGRIDDQVQIRSNRVELGEVQASLEQHKSIQRCAVLVKKDNTGSRQLAAYVVTKNGSELSVSGLKDFLSKKLPDYMIPAYFLFLDEMPLNSSGKINKHALPDPDLNNLAADTEYTAPRTKLEKFVYNLWRGVLKIEHIGIHDNFFTIGGNSIQGAVFVNRLQEELNEYVYIVAIYDAPTIAQLCAYIIKEYPQSAQRISGEKITGESAESLQIDQDKIDRLRSIIRIPDYKVSPAGAAKQKNPSAVFVLSSPRSGSTLTRAMLGGHPKLFSPPELQLLNYDTLQERKTILSGRDDFWLDGTIRVIMEIKQCSEDEARLIMAGFEDQNLTIKEFYSEIQNELGEQLFVDKTPNYALGREIMEQAEVQFENPKYIHLVRHPYGVIPSFEKARLHVFYPPFFKEEHDFTSRQLAELIWTLSHQNILRYLNTIPEERRLRVHYEDLVQSPEQQMKNICRFLDIDFHPDMLNPQKDSDKRMTDALNEHSKMLGDVRFHEHKGISADRAYKWKETLTEDFLGDETWQLVESFGYEKQNALNIKKKKALSVINKLPDEAPRPLSFAQERLWFLDQLEPGKAHYNMPVSLKVEGNLNKSILIQAIYQLAERQQSLRTLFKMVDTRAQQIILPEANIDIQEFNLAKTDIRQQQTEVTRIITKEARTPFNLSDGPLLRVVIIRISESEHFVMFNMHHIISDGLSVGIFFKELLTLYKAISENKKTPLPELPVQYADYATWQRNFLQGERLEKELAFWGEQISGAPSFLELPTDFIRPAVQSFKGRRIRFELSEELSGKIRALAGNYDSTIFMILVSAFNVLLYRYSHQETILTGTPAANRNRREVEGIIGFFINTLILRTDFDEHITFKELFYQLQKSTVAAFGHQDIPFEKIVDSLKIERSLSHNPLFQVMFAYQPQILQENSVHNLKFKPVETDTGIAKFDMTLSMAEHGKILGGEWEYSTALFSSASIQRMLDHFTTLLESIVLNPDQDISALPLLGKEEENQVLTRGISPAIDYPADKCIHHLIEQQAQLQPQFFAAGINDEALNFEQLNARANQTAAFLIKSGIEQKSIIGILMERSTDMIVSMLAVWKAGCAYLPLDPAYPQDRLSFMLQDAKVPLLLTHSLLADTLPESNMRIIPLDTEWEKIASESTDNPNLKIQSQDLAYIIYTSGTTGKPKGVMISHNSALHLAENLKQTVYSRFDKKNLKISLNAPIPFDASVQQIVMLAHGHGLQIIPMEARGSGESMLDYIRKYKIQILDCVPAQLKLMLDAGLLEDGSWKPLAVLPGGEAIDEVTWETLAASKEVQFFNMYGPTECTVDSTICHIQSSPQRPVIGKPVSNARFYILDPNSRPVPAGAAGELYIAGAGLAQGYLNRLELTSEKFISDPFSKEASARMYKSGDLVRWLSDGNVEFLGRVDHQVKIRGFRMELGEIEANLRRYKDIKDAVVLAKEIKADDKRLAAYLLAENGKTPNISEIRSFLKETLPDYMVPAVFMSLESFPLLPSGKINRDALPEPEFDRSDLGIEYVEASTDKEKILTDIWKAVLGIKQIGTRDNFFELGGDSILSIQVVARANQAGLKITPKQMFENPTIERLAAAAKEGAALNAEQGLVTGTFPLTAIQHDFFSRNLPDKHHWNQTMFLALENPLNTIILEQVITHLLTQHDLLRAFFNESNSSIQAEISGEIQNSILRIVDLTTIKSDKIDMELEKLVNELQASLNLTEGPLLRIACFQTPEGHPDYLLLIIHHLVVDVVSWRILTEDLLSLFTQLSAGQPVKLPPKTTSFKYWTERINTFAASEAIHSELDYWKKIAAQPAAALPKDKNGINTEAAQQIVQAALSVEETSALLKEAPAAYHTQINELLLTALVRAVKHWHGQDSVLIDLESHGREDLFEDVDISRTIGWFTSFFPIHLHLTGIVEPGESIKEIKEQYRKIPNNGIGYGLLKHLNNDLIKTSIQPEIGFNYLGQFQQNSAENKLLGKPLNAPGFERSPDGERPHILEIGGSIFDSCLHITFAYSKEQYFEETIRIWADQYLEELRVLIRHCQDPESGSYTPSDFADVDLDEEELGGLLEELED